MEKDISYELEALNSHEIKNHPMASGNPEDHGDSNESEEPYIRDQNEENEDEENTGAIILILHILILF